MVLRAGRIPNDGNGAYKLGRPREPAPARSFLRPPLVQEGVDPPFELIEVATERAETLPADIGELVDDPLGVVDAHRKLDPLAQPGDRQLVLPDLVVGQTSGVAQPYVIGIRRLQLRPHRCRFVLSPGAKVELGDV